MNVDENNKETLEKDLKSTSLSYTLPIGLKRPSQTPIEITYDASVL